MSEQTPEQQNVETPEQQQAQRDAQDSGATREYRDTGDQAAVPAEQQRDVDPDPAESGEENTDAHTEGYDVPEGQDTELPDEQQEQRRP